MLLERSIMSSNFKRHRAPSHTSSSSSTSTVEAQHPSKASRTVSGQSGEDATRHPLLCTLPPTCNHRPTPLASTRDLETHYATYHAHVCEQGGCGAVFPDARLLELHQTECHDPLAAVKKDRGEKIFACHLPSCARLFSTPKTRRLHLIQAHGYPKEYFFAVTNKGVGGLLKRWGEGASMIRGEWKARESKEDDEDDDEDTPGQAAHDVDSELATPTGPHPRGPVDRAKEGDDSNMDESLDGLADTMESLTLVPPSIRFGRGGRKGGFLHNSQRGVGDVDRGHDHGPGGQRGRGRGGRGRGRGGFLSQSGMDIDNPQVPQVAQPQYPLGRAGRGRAGILHAPSRGRGFFKGNGPK
ncbi:hypothetical protein D9615_007368 [Tricholomella constricta]|uniref:C2H2-type domain-containing protein n=1 Tax=Tricholomella constricta TaxID=117010 RepID=A0A8H5GYE9_9AGAR|nr:hypothetical protein D9615_007368 [Tricholomella constricta]